MSINYIRPTWPLSKKVKAFTTMRNGGKSEGLYSSLNLATHVNDDTETVLDNREILIKELGLPKEPLWVNQVHSSKIIEVPVSDVLIDDYNVNKKLREERSSLYDQDSLLSKIFDVDAVYTKFTNEVCAILTADCVPILLCNSKETEVCAVHAGWKGIINGIVQNSVYNMEATTNNKPEDFLYAWIGPCIGPLSFEVGSDVLLKFIKMDQDFSICFTPNLKKENKWFGNLPLVVSIILQKCGIKKENIFNAEIDTYTDQNYYSYRRDGANTGRFISMIWLEDN